MQDGSPQIDADIEEAVELDEKGVKTPQPKRRGSRKALEVPGDLVKALTRNRQARATFEDFSYSNRKDYVEWLAEGKARNRKYMKGRR